MLKEFRLAKYAEGTTCFKYDVTDLVLAKQLLKKRDGALD